MTIYFSLLLLFCQAAAGLWWSYRNQKRCCWFVSPKSLAMFFFTVFYPISGVCHIVFASNFYRGFFDMMNGLSGSQSEEIILRTAFLSVTAMGSLYFGMRRKRPTVFSFMSLDAVDSKLLATMGLFFLILGIYATAMIASQIDFLEIERGRQLASGTARYVFLSSWLTWGATFLLLLAFSKAKTTRFKVCVYLLFIVLVGGNVSWSGGRSIALLLALPGLLSITRLDHRNRKVLFLITAILFGAYVIVLSLVRKQGYDKAGIDITEMLDWEAGRLSMVGYAVDYVRRVGFLNGESILFGLASILTSPLYLLGINVFDSSLRPVVSTIGYDLFGDMSSTYVVPGIVPELYMNFGVLAVAAGMYFIGAVVSECESSICYSSKMENIFLAYYVSVVVCLNLLNSSLLAFLNYVFLTGFPLWLYWIFKKVLKPRSYINQN